jgi:hypothetical protein
MYIIIEDIELRLFVRNKNLTQIHILKSIGDTNCFKNNEMKCTLLNKMK